MIPKFILKNFINVDEKYYTFETRTGSIKEHNYSEDKNELIKTIVYEFTESNMVAFDNDTFENKILFLKDFTGLENITEFDIVDTGYDVDRDIYYTTIDLYGDRK